MRWGEERKQKTPPKRGSKLVGERGFEPPTHWSQTSCATKLRYSPNYCFLNYRSIRFLFRHQVLNKKPCAAGSKIGRRERIRTSDPLVPNQLRYQAALLADVLLFELLIQFIIKSWCEGGDSNPHILRTLTPEASASTNSATFAISQLYQIMGWLMGFEPTTTGITIQGSTN